MELSSSERVRQNAGRAQRWITAHADLVSVLLIAFAVLRILATLTVFSATADEPVHVTAGLQLVEEGRYSWQLENPPLPRVLFGWLIGLGGTPFEPAREPMDMMRWLFYATGHYKTSLFLARAGSVPFFLIAALAAWWLARRTLGRSGGLLAVLLFTTQPVLLGFGGIANHDMACAAGVGLALVAFWRWLEEPTPARAFVTGICYGLSVGMKFSNLLFTAAACAALFLVQRDRQWKKGLLAIPLVAAGAFLGLWASYGFAFGSIREFGLSKPPATDSVVARVLQPLDESTPIPMPHFFVGLSGIAAIDRGGFLAYAFGRRTTDGWWWYFPAAVLLKTALATIVFAAAGFLVARGRHFAAAMAAVGAILLVCAPSTLDLGVRYVLPLYIPLTVAAAAGALAMLRHAKPRVRVAALVLLVWQSVASLLAHPDYFPYFNELAGREPGWALVDSNLDWGQDVLRLGRVVRQKRIEKIGIIVPGWHDFDALRFPPSFHVEPWVPAQGWVAVSEHLYRMIEPDGGFWWLRGRKYERVGKSIRLYYVP